MLRSRLLMSPMLMNADNGEGGGGETPPPAGEQPPPQNQEQPPAPPAPSPLEARLAQLETAIIQLAAGGVRPPQAPTPGNESEVVDESQLHPELIKMNRKMEKTLSAQLNRMQDNFDAAMYAQTVRQAGLPAEVTQSAEQLFAAWKQSGMMVTGPNGPQAPTRADALKFTLGDLAMQGKLPAQGKQPVPPHGGGQPPARGAAPVNITVNLDPAKMTRAERIAAQEKALDEEGF